jgi:hypothetical protein
LQQNGCANGAVTSNGTSNKKHDGVTNGHANGVGKHQNGIANGHSHKASDYYIKSDDITKNLTQRKQNSTEQ